MRKPLSLVLLIAAFLLSLKSHSETKASVEILGLSFLSSDFDNTSKNNFSFLGATLKSNAKKPELFMVDLEGYYAIGNSALSSLNIREIYFALQPAPDSQLFIGRKLKNWSALDSNWNLGFFQPQLRSNPLTPDNQGLTGLFWDHNEKFWSISLFASPLFIPDQGPSYEIKDGQFQSSNPWFHAPPQNIKFQGQILPIDYNVSRPETEDVVFNSVYALQVQLGQNTGYFSKLAAAYKPAQQLALGYNSVLVTDRVRVDIKPVVYSENLFAADFGYQDDWGLAEISFLQTKPGQPYFTSTNNTPTLEDSLSWGPRWLYYVRPFQLEVSYIDTQGGKVSEKGPDTSTDRLSLTQRFIFRQALQFQINYTDVFLRKMKLQSQLQFRVSEKDQFKQIRFRNTLDLKGPWSFWSDILLIETADDAQINMNTFRNLDQLWIGASYDI